MSKRQSYSRAFKLQVLAEIAGGKPVPDATREYGLSRNAIYKWQALHEQYGDIAFAGNGEAYTVEARMSEMERTIGRLTVENSILKKLIKHRQDTEKNQ